MISTWSRRILLFALTNVAVLVLLGFVLRVLGLDALLAQSGFPVASLLGLAAVFGFGGALVSLSLSRQLAVAATGARVIDQPRGGTEHRLVRTVGYLAAEAGVPTPDIAIYTSPEPNAFATGARRDRALVAVSTGLVQRFDRHEVEAVLAHEIAHIANGDMVTMGLLQGVLNTFVIFLARAVGLTVDRSLTGSDRVGPTYWLVVVVAELGLGLLATVIVMAYSRQREFHADADAARLVGVPAMVDALEALRFDGRARLPADLAAFGIRQGVPRGIGQLFRSHPTIDERIRALGAQPVGPRLVTRLA